MICQLLILIQFPLIRIPYTHYNNIIIDDLLIETSDFIVKENNNE